MNNIEMKNRWIALYVENEVGVLAKVSGLFSAKSYNLQSLTVGTTEAKPFVKRPNVETTKILLALRFLSSLAVSIILSPEEIISSMIRTSLPSTFVPRNS